MLEARLNPLGNKLSKSARRLDDATSFALAKAALKMMFISCIGYTFLFSAWRMAFNYQHFSSDG